MHLYASVTNNSCFLASILAPIDRRYGGLYRDRHCGAPPNNFGWHPMRVPPIASTLPSSAAASLMAWYFKVVDGAYDAIMARLVDLGVPKFLLLGSVGDGGPCQGRATG